MQEALDAIADIKEALQDVGSDITFNQIEKGAYDVATGSAKTVTPVLLKAFVNSKPSTFAQAKANDDDILKDYQFSITTYTELDIDKNDTILFNGNEYEILLIVPSFLQNIAIKYEILIKK